LGRPGGDSATVGNLFFQEGKRSNAGVRIALFSYDSREKSLSQPIVTADRGAVSKPIKGGGSRGTTHPVPGPVVVSQGYIDRKILREAIRVPPQIDDR